MGLVDNIKARMKLLDMSQHQLAKVSGVTQPSINRLLTGKVARPRFLPDIARALGVTVDALVSGNVNPPMEQSDIVSMRLIGEVQAGSWKDAVELPVEDQLVYPIPVGDRPFADKLFLLRARGDSMNQADAADGTLLICMDIHDFVGNCRDIEPGDRVIAHREDHGQFEATVKVLELGPDGTRWLVPKSDNPAHQPIMLKNPDDWNGEPEVSVRAVVVGHIALNL